MLFVVGDGIYSIEKVNGHNKNLSESERVELLSTLGAWIYLGALMLYSKYRIGVPIIYQDSTLVIFLITKVGGVARSKCLRARMNLGRDRRNGLYCICKINTWKGNKTIGGHWYVWQPEGGVLSFPFNLHGL